MTWTSVIFYALLLLLGSGCQRQHTPKGGLPDNYEASSLTPPHVPLDTNKVLDVIAFGSCNRQDKEQPIWPLILQNDPDLWIWLGDNIYGDSEDPQVMKTKYAQQNANAGYRLLLDKCPIIGTWDDHDYGKNDGDRHFPAKAQNKQFMLDFLCVPKNAAVRLREGVYQAYTFGTGERRVKIILLDARWFKAPLEKDASGYVSNPTGELLGEAQWQWLEQELRHSDAALTIIANGSQIIPEEHPFEKWANYPRERFRLFSLIDKTKTSGVVLLSGDRHWAELSKITLPKLSTPLYELTASGLTHVRNADDEANRYRVGTPYAELNFGLIRIDWEKRQASLEIRGMGNTLHLSQALPF